MDWIWIRHGMTEGNREKRYIGGRTDEELCKAGRQALEEKRSGGFYPPADRVYVSPMKRCLETAEILYPEAEKRIVEGFRECDFGLFERKNAKELAFLPEYQSWLDSGGAVPFPKGESPEGFKRRCKEALLLLSRKEKMPEKTAFVVHGGIIMALFSQFDEAVGGFYDYYTDNGAGYACSPGLKDGRLVFRNCRKLF